jgi:hypothetical protein
MLISLKNISTMMLFYENFMVILPHVEHFNNQIFLILFNILFFFKYLYLDYQSQIDQ